MTPAEEAIILMEDGLNCSQAVLISFGRMVGLDRETATGIGSAFGGGMGCTGLTCGAVTGSLMVIGLHCDKVAGPAGGNKLAYALTREFIRRFAAREGSIECAKLMGVADRAEGKKIHLDGAKFREICPKLVHRAAEILDAMLVENSQ